MAKTPSENPLVELVGTKAGDKMLFSDWVREAREQGLRPDTIQRLKRQKLLHTVLDEHGHVYVVRGARAA